MRDIVTRFVRGCIVVVVVVLGVVILEYQKQTVEAVQLVALVLVVLAVYRITVMSGRFLLAPRAAKANYPAMLKARYRWRWLTRNLGIAYKDPHGKTIHRSAIGMTMGENTRVEYAAGHIRYPKAKFRADAFGWKAVVKTTPKAGRIEFEKQCQHIADEWQCCRVQVSQPKPGRLIVRGMRTDPLTVPLHPGEIPPEDGNLFTPYLGRDEWGQSRYRMLKGVTGITVGGLPGYGKTSLTLRQMYRWAASPAVQFVIIDGKGGGDYMAWEDRAWLISGDDLAEAADHSKRAENLMRSRLDAAGTIDGPRNRWDCGPTPDYPLVVVVWDECHTFFDLEAVKGDKDAEKQVRQCRSSAAQMVKKGRSALYLNVFITQKQTGDAIPTAIRDICGLGFSFACKTRDAAVASLGETIRDYPSVCPTTLQEPEYVGVCTASLKTGSDPFTRLRIPAISEDEADARAMETASLRRDPEELLAVMLGSTSRGNVRRLDIA